MNFGSYTNLTSLFTSIGNKLRKKVSFELVTQAEYNALVQAGTVDPNVDYHIYNASVTAAPIDDTTTASDKVWSSNKVNTELSARDALGAKNLLPNVFVDRTYIGVTATPNNDGTFTVNGTFEFIDAILVTNTWFESDVAWIKSYEGKSVKLSGGVQNCVIAIRFNDSSGNEIGFIQTNYNGSESNATIIPSGIAMYAIYIYPSGTITLNNALFKPMLRLASITDDTYVPYARTNQELTGEVEPMLNLLGAKNLQPNEAVTQTINGVTFTVNADGSVTVNGTATAETWYVLYSDTKEPVLPIGNYIISGTVPNKAYVYVSDRNADNTGWGNTYTDTGNGIFYPRPNNYHYVYAIHIMNGTVLSNDVVKPMIRIASIADDTYVPYAMTNRELTNSHKATVLTVSTSGWVTDTTSQSGTTLYKKEISLSHVYVPCPEVAIGASGTTLPTKAQQTAYDLVQYATVDSSTNKLYLYASAVPSTQFYIKVTGVD